MINVQPRTSMIGKMILAVCLTATLIASSTFGQNGRPGPAKPESQGGNNGNGNVIATDAPANPGKADAKTPTSTGPTRTRQPREGKVVLAFNDTPLDETIPFIVEATGKVVMPISMNTLKNKKITLLNDEPVDRAAALDLLFTALRLNGVGVIETDQVVILDVIENIRIKGTPPVYTADDDVLSKPDNGQIVVKIYRLKEALVDSVKDQLADSVPDYGILTPDANSNQLILSADIGTAQHIQKLINQLDRNYLRVETRNFRLQYADAQLIADQIFELFSPGESPAQGGQGRQQRPAGRNARQPAGGAAGTATTTAAGASGPGPVVELRISVNVQQNTVTVVAEPEKIAQIARLIETEWDLPRPPETATVYKLQHTDPLKVRDLLQDLLGSGGGSSRSGGSTGGRNAAGAAGGGAGGGSISEVLGDIYRIQAYPDQNSVVVLSKTKESVGYLDSIIEAIDQPSSVGLPAVVPLKHANAINLAEEINVLLAETGAAGSGLAKPDTGLTGQGFDDSDGTSTPTNTGTSGGTAGQTMQFPWQTGRTRDDQTEPSPLIGKVRVVPIVRENALSVLAPAQYRQPMIDLIQSMDRPGRQVMISAVIAQVELNDDLALGLRFSSGEIVPSLLDNAIGGTGAITGTQNNLLPSLFDTSVLDVDVNLTVLLQALRQKTNIRILQEPSVFTADNQEAEFFNGQEIPRITNTNTSDVGGFQQSFEFEEVGVFLNARPRITAERDVDMEIKLQLSNVVPGQTVSGQFILDKRRTQSKIVVKNGQTIVLSGILTDTDSQITRGVPLLMDLPFIGEIFKSRENSRKTTELIAFITPVVVDRPEENDSNFNKRAREHLQDLTKPLGEQSKYGKTVRDRIVTPLSQPIDRPNAEDATKAPKREDEQPSDSPVDIDDVSKDSQ